MAGDQIRVNGFAHSWGSIICKVEGDRFSGFNLIEYGDKIEETQATGMGVTHAPQWRSKGKYSTDPGKIGGRKSSIQDLRALLASFALDGRSYGQVVFQIVVQFREPGDATQTVELIDCRLLEDKSSHDEATTDPLTDEVGYSCMRIKRNGLTLYDSSEE